MAKRKNATASGDGVDGKGGKKRRLNASKEPSGKSKGKASADAAVTVRNTRARPTFNHFDELVLFEIIRHLDIWDLGNVAMTSKTLKEEAESAFRRGQREINIDPTKTLKQTSQILRLFGPWVKSIAIDGNNNPFYFMKVLSVIRPANDGSLTVLSLRGFNLNLFGRFKLKHEEQVRTTNLLENLKEISFTNCQFKNFSSVFSKAAKSLEKITLENCRLDRPTYSLWRESYPQLRKLVLIDVQTQTRREVNDDFTEICRRNPLIEELTLGEPVYTDDLLNEIRKMSKLRKLELICDEYPYYLGTHAPPQLESLKLKLSLGGEDELFRVLSNITPMKKLTELHIEGADETGPESREFDALNEHNHYLDFPKLEKLTIFAEETHLKLFQHVFSHMRNLTFFTFHGDEFQRKTLLELVRVAPRLQIVNIVAQSALASRQQVMEICKMAKRNDLITILRTWSGEPVRVHRHPNGLLLYPCNAQGHAQRHSYEKYKIGEGREFERAEAIAKRNVCFRIIDGFQEYDTLNLPLLLH